MEREQGSPEFNQARGESSSASVTQASLSGAPQEQASKDYERTEFCHIQLDATLADYLRKLGGGEVSKGVAIAGRLHQAMHRAGK
jgi:hypothetical protein